MDASLQTKYHKALKQLQVLHRDNTELKKDYNGIKNQLISHRNKYEALERSSSRELEELRANLENKRKTEINRQINELEDRFQN